MPLALERLPAVLVFAGLTAIFACLRRQVKPHRINLWIAAWAMLLLHALSQLLQPVTGQPSRLISAVDLVALQLAGVLFILSLTIVGEVRRWRRVLLLSLPVPIVVYSTALSFGLDLRWLYVACLVTLFVGSPVFVFTRHPRIPFPLGIMLPFFVCGAVAFWGALSRNYQLAIVAILSAAYALPGALFPRRYRIRSAGVFIVVAGFFVWGLTFPLAAMQKRLFPGFEIDPALWNLPQLTVAVGMIMTLLDEKSRVLDEARMREHAGNLQLRRFAGVTLQLSSGIDVQSFCDKIAVAISETSNFKRAGILLCNDDQSLYVPGCHGASAEDTVKLKTLCASWSLTKLAELCEAGERIGQSAVYLKLSQVLAERPAPLKAENVAGPVWERGDELLVPLLSSRGAYIGCIVLDHPRQVGPGIFDEITKIELLAGDLAVTLENAMLHRQLIRSEKLASLGQLVAGVAHELNNPLAAVIGYADLLTEEVTDSGSRQKLDSLVREAQRMKRIIQNLLRFARQRTLTHSSSRVEPIVREVLTLREYHMQSHGVEVITRIDPELPEVAMNEDELKQILLNIFNNAVDAVQSVPHKKIEIECTQHGERVVIRFEDSGPGFADINRAFDPFYTTKALGKGTGLGLSICYGMVKEHGGDIFLKNRWPSGASVVIELPLASSVASQLKEARESTVS